MPIIADIQAMLDHYDTCYMAGDAAACAEFYMSNGEIHSPYGPPIRGHEAIAQAHEEWFALGETNKTITVVDADIAGDLAYCLARYTADLPLADDTSNTDNGASLNTLRRQPEGGYLIQHTGLIPDPTK